MDRTCNLGRSSSFVPTLRGCLLWGGATANRDVRYEDITIDADIQPSNPEMLHS
ncbi:predicted protein [Plenodomus lingam JN3]|uniref:Predicted protein n=1 Tax=Leptosphaeria maculans (strain JN3 / isolate v23.1.3 / race Av1-4-5-6-7-8) TaxID=985895 RepID=E4ZRG0_LEPMJ|nr:predicted protein [Plenodomus lingam JN3]CBX93807.1 predicted protein [Plenodomus lingam JN3]